MQDILIQDLYKSFGEKPVLRGFTARLPAGRITCLTGPSGCGKTTLLQLLMGFLAPDAGQILGLPDKTGAVFQEDRLLEEFSALYNAAFAAPHAPKALVLEHLGQLGLGGDAHRPVKELSGGMRRRVALARAVLSDSRLLLLDEPFKGLDAATRSQALTYLQRQAAGRTVLLVTHDPALPRQLGAAVIRLQSPAG